jgi:hypothetical protein
MLGMSGKETNKWKVLAMGGMMLTLAACTPTQEAGVVIGAVVGLGLVVVGVYKFVIVPETDREFSRESGGRLALVNQADSEMTSIRELIQTMQIKERAIAEGRDCSSNTRQEYLQAKTGAEHLIYTYNLHKGTRLTLESLSPPTTSVSRRK